jgi:hypothetical protein
MSPNWALAQQYSAEPEHIPFDFLFECPLQRLSSPCVNTYRIHGDSGSTRLRLWRIERGVVTAFREGHGIGSSTAHTLRGGRCQSSRARSRPSAPSAASALSAVGSEWNHNRMMNAA